ncbi:hypothetical protein CGA22_26330 [Pseudomonas sp. PSB18]|nr:hypothetical protein [Pseudomonas sp. PSB18]
MWERACSRRRQHIQHGCKLTHCYREQARSHRGFGGGMGSVGNPENFRDRHQSVPFFSSAAPPSQHLLQHHLQRMP